MSVLQEEASYEMAKDEWLVDKEYQSEEESQLRGAGENKLFNGT